MQYANIYVLNFFCNIFDFLNTYFGKYKRHLVLIWKEYCILSIVTNSIRLDFSAKRN